MIPLADHPASRRLAELAEDFCELVESHSRMEPEAFLHALHHRLPVLYDAGLTLPDEPPADDDDDALEDQDELIDSGRDPDRPDPEQWHALFHSLGKHFGVRDTYREVFDPYEPKTEEPVTGSLADDVADIYFDLADGRAKWRRGEREDAVWTWRFHFQSHWGTHLLSALRAINSQASLYGLGWSSNAEEDA